MTTEQKNNLRELLTEFADKCINYGVNTCDVIDDEADEEWTDENVETLIVQIENN